MARLLGAHIDPVEPVDAATVGYFAGWKLVGWLPEKIVRKLFEIAADVISKNGRGMQQLRLNLIRVVGAENVTKKLVRDSVRSYARYWVEAFRLEKLSKQPDFWQKLKSGVIGEQYFQESYKRGKGVILCMPHTGNWDMAGAYLAHEYTGFTTVAERLRPESLFQAFVDFRHNLGFEVLALSGGISPLPRLKEVLENGGVVCLLAERDIKGRGIEVEFFGEITTMPVGSAQLAIETGAALHVVHSSFIPETTEEIGRKSTKSELGWRLEVSPQIPISKLPDMVQEMATQFAANIAKYPADWHILQPLWLADRKKINKNSTANTGGTKAKI
nr:phosphatidylinositol mannoside acyltransferase [Corynebacterium caspium]